MKLISYVAFLRGINVGGNKIIKMAELKKAFESIGFLQVQTVLASGNVLFASELTNLDTILKQIEINLEKAVGTKSPVILRTGGDIQHLIRTKPFKNIDVTVQTRLYVTFLSQDPTLNVKSTLKIPYTSPEKDIRILSVTKQEVLSVMTASSRHNSLDLMKILETEFGKSITTRNWNTVIKIGKILS